MEPREVLKRYWGYDNFRPLQEDIVRSVLKGDDTLGLLPTGGGKSICYQVPGIMLQGLCVVVTPLIALMKDQMEGLQKRGISAKALFSGMHRHEQEIVMNNAVNGLLKFLFVSPERLQSNDFLDGFRLMNVGMMAIDEAHCISQWGYDFRPPYLKIAEARQYHPNAPTLALTATATPEVVDDIQERLAFKKKNVFQKSFERKNVSYIALFEENKNKKLLDIIRKSPGTGIIYVRSRQKTKQTALFLREHGIASEFYHAGLSMDERDKKQNLWMKGDARVMVATNAFGMGIDKPDVRFVIHLDIPDSPEAYFQEAGRAGRDEKSAYAVLLWENADVIDLEKRFRESYPPLATIQRVYNALGNYFEIPLHSGYNQSFDFESSLFLKRYPFSTVELWSSLRFLEREGYLFITEQSAQPAQLMFKMDHAKLYEYQVANTRFDTFIKSILRNYSGLFSDFVSISIHAIASFNRITEEQVINRLKQLEKQDVVWFQPQKEKPQIVYTCERLSEKDVTLSKEVYAERKKSAQKRIESMIYYVQNQKICRSTTLLQFFGQKNAKPCGSCDVCRNRNALHIGPKLFDQIAHYLQNILQKNMLTADEINTAFPNVRFEKVLKVIQYLMDNEYVSFKDGKYQWLKK
ncbi:MAG: RecQ family ATP-dependent DNA helicase [Bacteroidales bacterium]|jgi:ATP-dependent DNA helicase RecQ|nr:RecQ family ATP-dependent DNA helicase [Bacteroidales bacterium]